MQTKTTTKSRITTAPVQTTAPQKSKSFPTREEIARRAYEIYVARGQAAGRDQDDWLQAERELLAKAHRNN